MQMSFLMAADCNDLRPVEESFVSYGTLDINFELWLKSLFVLRFACLARSGSAFSQRTMSALRFFPPAFSRTGAAL